MTTPFRRLAWTAAFATYLLVVLGAVVRITGSGMGCGDDWPLCHGHLIPPLSDYRTFLEWSHRQVAVLVSILVFALAGYGWARRHDPKVLHRVAATAASLLIVQVLLGAVTVKLELPHWTVVLHLATAMLLLATLLLAAAGWRGAPDRASRWALILGFVTVLLGGMTAKMGAAGACVGFPLCNGEWMPTSGGLQHIHWTHRLLAYGLAAYAVVWLVRRRTAGPAAVLGLVGVQVAVGAWLVTHALPQTLQAAHVAVGTGVWVALVLVALRSAPAR